MKLCPQFKNWNDRRRCGGFIDFLSGKTSTANTSTTVAVDSYNRAFNSVRNNSNSGNLQISVGGGDPFGTPSEKVQKAALLTAAALAVLAVVLLYFKRRT